MLHLTPKLFLVPIIVSIVVTVAGFILGKRTSNSRSFGKFILIALSISFSLNFAWEIFHSPLYQGYVNNAKHVLISALASLADALMVLLLYIGFAFLFKNPYWIQSLTIKRTALVAITGGTGAIVSEMIHIFRGDWVYASAMPIVPVLNFGLSPLLQFIILPLTSYFLSFNLLKLYSSTKSIYFSSK
jgi:hypothetical protein